MIYTKGVNVFLPIENIVGNARLSRHKESGTLPLNKNFEMPFQPHWLSHDEKQSEHQLLNRLISAVQIADAVLCRRLNAVKRDGKTACPMKWLHTAASPLPKPLR